MNLIGEWLFWAPDIRLEGWLAYSAAILIFWFAALRLLRRMIGRTLPLWAPAILFLFPCRLTLETEAGETMSWLAPALPTLLLALFGDRRQDLRAALEAAGLAAIILLPVWLALRFYLQAAAGKLPTGGLKRLKRLKRLKQLKRPRRGVRARPGGGSAP